jgi:type I restriction enzyme S subunit
MSEIEELLMKHCPKGVPNVALEEVIDDLRTGLNPRSNFQLNTPDATNYYVTVRELNGFGLTITEKTDRVNDEGLKLILRRSRLMKLRRIGASRKAFMQLLQSTRNWMPGT